MLTYLDKRLVLRRHTVLRSARLVDAEPYDLSWVPKGTQPSTGGWRFNHDAGRNEILLNECLDELADVQGPPAGLAIQTYLHEVAHSLWSDSDFRRLGELLKANEIPFLIHNLFEDARIEARWRRQFGHRFGWLRWNRPPWDYEFLATLPPEAVFLGLITLENQRDELHRLLSFSARGNKEGHDRTLRILHFFRLATRKQSPFTGSTTDIVPLCRLWLDEFPRPMENAWVPRPGSIHGDDYRAAPDPADRSASPFPWQEPKPIPESLRHWDEKAKAALWRQDCNRAEFDPSIGARFEILVAKSLPAGIARCKTITAAKRLSLRDHARGAERIYMTRRPDPDGVPRVALVVDCSGSMWHDPHLAGLTLLQIVNHLHRSRKIEGHVYLTFGTGSAKLPLPFPDDHLFSLDCDGPCEGIEACFETYQAELRQADLINVYTDGNILDTPFDREKWRRQGIETYGLYVGHPSKVELLKQWFDYPLVRSNIQQLLIAWTRLLQRHHG